MRLSRVIRLRLGLILALLLPLQAFSALPNCAQRNTHQDWQTTQSAVDTHCDHGHPSAIHHECGRCCSVAAAGIVLELWAAPPAPPSQPTLAPLTSPASIAADRLDRPPRFQLP